MRSYLSYIIGVIAIALHAVPCMTCAVERPDGPRGVMAVAVGAAASIDVRADGPAPAGDPRDCPCECHAVASVDPAVTTDRNVGVAPPLVCGHAPIADFLASSCAVRATPVFEAARAPDAWRCLPLLI